MKYKIIVDKQSRTNPSSEKKQYEVDIEELRYKDNVYDSLVITKDETYVIRRLSLSELHVLSVLEQEVKEPLKDLNIELFEGDNYIYLLDMTGNKFYAEYLIKNDFNDIYVTTNEMNSAIKQTAQSIELNVNQKLTGYSTTEEMNASINMKADEIQSSVSEKLQEYDKSTEVNSKITQKADEITSTVNSNINTKLGNYSTTAQMNSAIQQKADSITSSVSSTYATKTQLNTAKTEIKQTTDSISSTVSKKVGNNEVISKINQTSETVKINANKIELSANDILNLLAGNTINLKSKNILIASDVFNVNSEGKVIIKGDKNVDDLFRIEKKDNSNIFSYIQPIGAGFVNGSNSKAVYIMVSDDMSIIDLYGANGHTEILNSGITTPILTQTSLKSKKKNIKKLKISALDLVRNADICEYRFKGEKAKAKKHIGLVIGEGYNCPDEVISEDMKGVEQYSMISLAWKAIQELIEENDNLKQRIEKLEVQNGKN